MFIEESIKIHHVSAIGIAIRHVSVSAVVIAIRSVSPIGIAILSTGITIALIRVAGVKIFEPHERVRPLTDLLFHTRVILKICIKLRMALQELRVVDQGRRFAKLVGNFSMTIKKLIKSRQVSACDVIALDSLPVLRGRRLRMRATREAQQRHGRRAEKQCCFSES